LQLSRNKSQIHPPALERRSLLQELMLRGVRITGQRRILIETLQAVLLQIGMGVAATASVGFQNYAATPNIVWMNWR
jgi:hypothetical protein